MMSDEDARELEARRSYDQFVEHMDRFMVECGASEKRAHVIGRHLVWWAAVLAKTHGWLTGFVAIAAVVALLGLLATLGIKDIIGIGG